MRGSQVFSELYRGTMARNGEILGVEGMWSGGDNLASFNLNLAKGMSFNDAARNTFTGKMAEKYGFTNVTITSLNGKWDHIAGNFKYTKAYVTFAKN